MLLSKIIKYIFFFKKKKKNLLNLFQHVSK